MKTLLSLLIFFSLTSFAEEVIEIENHLGEKITLSRSDIAKAISTLKGGKVEAEEINRDNGDGSVNIINPKVSYKGEMEKISGGRISPKGICALFDFQKFHTAQTKRNFLCRSTLTLKENGDISELDTTHCRTRVTSVTCSEYIGD